MDFQPVELIHTSTATHSDFRRYPGVFRTFRVRPRSPIDRSDLGPERFGELIHDFFHSTPVDSRRSLAIARHLAQNHLLTDEVSETGAVTADQLAEIAPNCTNLG